MVYNWHKVTLKSKANTIYNRPHRSQAAELAGLTMAEHTHLTLPLTFTLNLHGVRYSLWVT